MIKEYRFPGFSWVRLEGATNDEVRTVSEKYNLDLRIASDLASPTPKQRVEVRGNFIYSIFHIPAFKHTHSKRNHIQEIDIVIGKDVLITSQYDTIDALHKFSLETEVSTILSRETDVNSPITLFVKIMTEIYASLGDEVAFIEDWVRDIEKNIFAGKERKMVFALSNVSRNLLELKRTLSPHEDNLAELQTIAHQAKNRDFSTQIETLIDDEYLKLKNAVKNNTDLVSDLRDTNNELLSTKQNEIMKVLTILAFITLPISVIADIFGMNTIAMPIIGQANDFWIVIGIMLVVSVIMIAFFKFKKWL